MNEQMWHTHTAALVRLFFKQTILSDGTTLMILEEMLREINLLLKDKHRIPLT